VGILIAIAAIVLLVIYLRGMGATGDAEAWKSLSTINTQEGLQKFAETAPDSTASRVARLQEARMLLGPLGIDQLNSINPDVRGKAVKSIDAARALFAKLEGDFAKDKTLQAMAIEGAAKAELALVGVPKEGTSLAAMDSRGSVDKAVELYRKYAKLFDEKSPLAEAAKKTADELEKNKQDVVQLSTFLNTKLAPNLPQPEIKAPPSLTPEAK
jgi:hypothetical protein